MMFSRAWLFVFGLLIAASLPACGGDEAFVCDPDTDQIGTYLLHYTNKGGTCGEIPDTVIVITAQDSAGVGCTIVKGEVSDDKCEVSGTITCPDPDTGMQIKMTGKLEQMDKDGNELRGLYSITLKDANGASVCTGTYEIEYKRQ